MSNEKDQQLEKIRLIVSAKKRLDSIRKSQCFDPRDMDSRPNASQLKVLQDISEYPHRYLIGGNQSGKSQTGGREAAWIFMDNHPYFGRLPEWKNAPLTMIIVGRTSKQVEEELWAKKILPFLDPHDIREFRTGGQLQKVVHKKNKNTILFFSHHSPEEAREKIQSYTAHWLWLDEMPNSFKLLEELHRRCQANKGRFLATFTPKLRNNDIRKLVDSVTDYQKTYRLGMLENPIYKGRELEVLAPLASLPAHYKKTILDGDWYIGDTAVYTFTQDEHVRRLPEAYSPSWRHIEAIDPAASSKAGYVLLAEDPGNKVWYVVRADYLQGASARDLLKAIDQRSKAVNLVKRISDPHETWFIKHAAEDGYKFIGVDKKNERKKELIKNLQESLDTKNLTITPWCDDLINEFTSCQWSETVEDKIVGSRRFHLLDALQYAVDNLPKPVFQEAPISHTQWLKKANHARIVAEEKSKKRGNKYTVGRLVAKRGRVLRGLHTI